MATVTESPKVFEMSTIRLSADETRLIVKTLNANGKPICDYHAQGLADMGILKRAPVAPKDTAAEVRECWDEITKAVTKRDTSAISKALGKISELKRPSPTRDTFVLTELGKQVARGITVKLNGQYAQTKC